jgi:hypothetical protein
MHDLGPVTALDMSIWFSACPEASDLPLASAVCSLSSCAILSSMLRHHVVLIIAPSSEGARAPESGSNLLPAQQP